MILGLSLLNTGNIGDTRASPLDYFEFPGEVVKGDARNMPDLTPDVVILGGGAVVGRAPEVRARYPDARMVLWGAGYTERGRLARNHPDSYQTRLEGFDLVGCRDADSGFPWVPCASCMSPELDALHGPQYPVVYYGHEALMSFAGEHPRFTNAAGSMAQVVEFLTAGEVVVAGSYHGAYWAALLGRKVIAVPFGSKFYHFQWPFPVTRHWRTTIEQPDAIRTYPDALNEARTANRRFHTLVLAL